MISMVAPVVEDHTLAPEADVIPEAAVIRLELWSCRGLMSNAWALPIRISPSVSVDMARLSRITGRLVPLLLGSASSSEEERDSTLSPFRSRLEILLAFVHAEVRVSWLVRDV